MAVDPTVQLIEDYLASYTARENALKEELRRKSEELIQLKQLGKSVGLLDAKTAVIARNQQELDRVNERLAFAISLNAASVTAEVVERLKRELGEIAKAGAVAPGKLPAYNPAGLEHQRSDYHVVPGNVGAYKSATGGTGGGGARSGIGHDRVKKIVQDLEDQQRDGAEVSVETWREFFNWTDIASVKDKIDNHHQPVLAVQPVTLEQFSDSFNNIPDTLKSYSVTGGHKAFHVKRENDWQYQVFKDTDAANPIMEISHVPAEKTFGPNTVKPSVVHITLTDQSDHSLYLAVVATKDLLERVGSQSKRFFIENCANDPEKAVKLYMIGKSLGLNPVLRDTPGTAGLIEASIAHAANDWTLKSETEILNLHALYQKVKDCDADVAGALIKNLQFKQPQALVANPAAPSAKRGMALSGLTAKPRNPLPTGGAAPPPPPPPPPPSRAGYHQK